METSLFENKHALHSCQLRPRKNAPGSHWWRTPAIKTVVPDNTAMYKATEYGRLPFAHRKLKRHYISLTTSQDGSNNELTRQNTQYCRLTIAIAWTDTTIPAVPPVNRFLTIRFAWTVLNLVLRLTLRVNGGRFSWNYCSYRLSRKVYIRTQITTPSAGLHVVWPINLLYD